MRRHVWLILTTVAIVAALVVVVARRSEPILADPPTFTSGDYADPDIARTITSATDAVLEDRSDRARWVKLAMVYQVNDMLPQAVQCYEQALSMDAEDVQSWYYLAILRSYGGDLDGAVQAMRRSIAISSSFGPAHRRLGEWLIDFGESEEAQRAFEQAIELDANDSHAHIGLARLALQSNRLEEASEILLRVTDAPSGQIPLAFQLLGTVYQRMGQSERAQRLMRQSRTITMVDGNSLSIAGNQVRSGLEAQLDQVKQIFLQRQFDEAIKRLRSLDELYPDDPVVPNNLGVVYRAQGRFEDSTREFKRAKLRNATYLEADYNIALNCVLEGASAKEPTRSLLFQSAQQYLDRVFAINPSYGPAVGLDGRLLRQHGKLELALDRLQEAARLVPGERQWPHSVAEVLHELGRDEEALEVLEQVLSSAPQFAGGYITSAYAYAALGRREEAEQALRAAMQWQPNHPMLLKAIRDLNIDVKLPTSSRGSPPNGSDN